MQDYSVEAKNWEAQLARQIAALQTNLAENQAKLLEIKNIEKLAVTVMELEDLEQAISNQGYVLAVLQQPWERWEKELRVQEFLSYFEAASALDPELLHFLYHAAQAVDLDDKSTLLVGALLNGEFFALENSTPEKKFELILKALRITNNVEQFMQGLEAHNFLDLNAEQIMNLQLEIKAEIAARSFERVRKEQRAMERALKIFEENK